VSEAVPGYPDWPGAQRVFRIERQRVFIRTGVVEEDTVYGVTSLRADRADAARLLGLVRQHWHIENRSHYVRDVTFGEDASLVRVGQTPRVMATLRNTAIALIRLTGTTQIAATCRRFAGKPALAIGLVTHPIDN